MDLNYAKSFLPKFLVGILANSHYETNKLCFWSSKLS